jgi:hypothetical protein
VTADQNMDISVEDLRTYARCPLEWFWEQRVGLVRPQTVGALVPAAIRTGLSFFYGGHAGDLPTAVGLVWQDWCEGWGEASLIRDLAEYAIGRSKILNLFATGHVHRPDGGRYAVPEMTTEYRMRMHSAGLTNLGRKLDEFARTHKLLPADEEDRPGSAMGDAFAASMASAEHVAPDLPAREVVLGWQVPYQVDLDIGVRLTGTADLVVQDASEPGDAILEVHDFESVAWIRAGLAGRDSRVIAASLAQPAPPGEPGAPGVAWQHVAQVTFRHWPTGQAFNFRETNTGHLASLVAAIARGMRHHVVIPRAVTGYDACRPCAYREHCWDGANWDTLPLIDAGTLGYAEALQSVKQELRRSLADGSQDARRFGRALDLLDEALRRASEPTDQLALLSTVRHGLEGIDLDGH